VFRVEVEQIVNETLLEPFNPGIRTVQREGTIRLSTGRAVLSHFRDQTPTAHGSGMGPGTIK